MRSFVKPHHIVAVIDYVVAEYSKKYPPLPRNLTGTEGRPHIGLHDGLCTALIGFQEIEAHKKKAKPVFCAEPAKPDTRPRCCKQHSPRAPSP